MWEKNNRVIICEERDRDREIDTFSIERWSGPNVLNLSMHRSYNHPKGSSFDISIIVDTFNAVKKSIYSNCGISLIKLNDQYYAD